MTQIGEGSYTPPTDPVDVNDGKVHVNIVLNIFKDGTSNNRVNIQSRLDNTAAYQKDQKQHKKKQDSYESDFTNIAKMEPHVDTDNAPPPGYQHVLAIYIEGPGTDDNEGDSKLGYGLGLGGSGVRTKVKKAILKAVEKIKKKLSDPEIIIDLLTINLFGFSRGAAGARNFIHKALHGDHSIKELLKEQDYTVAKVEVNFVGLYDTVSSHGLRFSNDTAALSLDAIKDAKSVLHLVAAEEYRENFSLTNITSTGKNGGGKGREIYLPGVHSNVGGSYHDGAPETLTLYAGQDARFASAYRTQLVDVGYYTEGEITLKDLTHLEGGEVTLTAERPAISNHYSKIPLNLMARAARNRGIVFKAGLDKKAEIPEELTELTTAQEKIHAYLDSATSKASAEVQAEYWLNNKEPWLKNLRHKHLHVSAKHEFGLKPRFKDGKRYRQTYAG